MSEKLKEFLTEDEKILWEGHPVPFKIMEKPYKTKLMVSWTVVILAALAAAIGFIASGLAGEGETSKTVIVLAVIAFIPLACIVLPIMNKGKIEKSTYLLTNKRAIVETEDNILAMEIDDRTPYKVEKMENGAEVLYMGTAAKAPMSKSRHVALSGLSEADDKVTDGVVFYSIKNANEICMKHTSFFIK